MNFKSILNRLRHKQADYLAGKKIQIPSGKKYLSFTFDDVPLSAFSNGQRILDSHDIKGTFYLSSSFLKGNGNTAAYYDENDVKNCIQKGHEIGCHTASHFHIYEKENSQVLNRDLLENQKILESIIQPQKLLNFSYPFGEQRFSAKKTVMQHYSSARSIKPGINRGQCDLYNLKSVQLYESKNSIESIESKLKDLNENGGWLVFYTHDIEQDYSKFGCSAEYFEKVVRLCLEYDVEILSVRDVVNKLLD